MRVLRSVLFAMRPLTTVLRSRIFGFVPGWLAFVLVLGGTALATTPVFNGNIFAGGVANWLATYAYGTNGTPIVSQSSSGQVATAGASRTSDGPTGGTPAAEGLMGWCFNDRSAGGRGCWSIYGEARAYATATAPGPTQSLELDTTSFVGSHAFDPYVGIFGIGGSSNTTMALWLASGGDCTATHLCYDPLNGQTDLTSQTASLAIGIINNGSDFYDGINFASNALHGDDGKTPGQTAPAINLAMGHQINWYYCDNTTSYPANCTANKTVGGIWSASTSPTTPADLVIKDYGMLVQPHSGFGNATQFRVNGAVASTSNINSNGFAFPGGTSGSAMGWNGNGDGSVTIYDAFSNPARVASFYYWNGSAYTEAANIGEDGTYTLGTTSGTSYLSPTTLKLGNGTLDFNSTRANAFTLNQWTYVAGRLSAESDGATMGYVDPAYSTSSATVAASWHTVQYSCAFASGTTCTVTLSGTASPFNSATSYSCTAPSEGTATGYIGYTVGNQTTTGFTVYASASNSNTVFGTCTGS